MYICIIMGYLTTSKVEVTQVIMKDIMLRKNNLGLNFRSFNIEKHISLFWPFLGGIFWSNYCLLTSFAQQFLGIKYFI